MSRGKDAGHCGTVNVTVPYGSGQRPLIRGYQSGSMERALRTFPQSACCSCMSMLLRLHYPLSPGVPANNVVVMMRRPRQRLLSAFYAGLHVGGEAAFGVDRLAALYSNVTCPAAFARFSGISNCQTKLLIGCSCGSVCAGIGNAVAWSAAHTTALADARRVLDAALFVALTEAFDLSVRLLHKALGLPPPLLATSNLRPGVAHQSSGSILVGGSSGSVGGHTYDEQELEISHRRGWSASQPWTGCHGVGVVPLVAWDLPTSRLEELDDKVYEHGTRRFRESANEMSTVPQY